MTGRKGGVWRDYGLSIALAVLFLVSLALQTWMGWMEFTAEQAAHDQSAMALGREGYIWRWGQATFENWQSEFLQLLTFVILSAFLIHRGSQQSKDGMDRLEAKIDRLLAGVAVEGEDHGTR